MGLLELPNELVWAILDQAVVTLGYPKVFRLRLVNKYFAIETLAAFYHTFAKQKLYKKDIGQLVSLRSHVIVGILREKVLLDRKNNNDLLVAIRKIVKRIITGSESGSITCRRQEVDTTHRLCELAVEHLGKFAVLRHLQADCDACYPFLKKNGSDVYDGEVDYMIAAAYLGKVPDELLETIRSSRIEQLESRYFGKPIPVAAARGNNTLVKVFVTNYGLHTRSLGDDRGGNHSYHEVGIDKALTHASAGGYDDTINLLLGSDFFDPVCGLSISNTEFEEAILAACRHGRKSTVDVLYRSYGTHCSHHPWWSSQISVLNQCILLEASRAGHASIVKRQLSSGVIPNCKDARARGETPLHYAAMHGHTETMRILLAHNAHVTDQQLSARPDPLYLAAEGGHIDAVKLLLAQPGIDVNGARDVSWPHDIAWPRSPLVGAASRGQDRMVRFLLDCPGIELERKSAGMQALYRAVQEGWESVAWMLWESGVGGRDWRRAEAFGRVMFGRIEGDVPWFLR